MILILAGLVEAIWKPKGGEKLCFQEACKHKDKVFLEAFNVRLRHK